MDVSTYEPDHMPLELSALLRSLYGSEAMFEPFLRDFSTSYSFCLGNPRVSFHPIACTENPDFIAHAALMLDSRLPAGEAFFGFLELPDDQAVFDALWARLLEEARARGVTCLKGPVNGSIWHQYRCVSTSDGTPYFVAEPFSQPHYYRMLAAAGPAVEIGYHSAYREPFDIVLSMIHEVPETVMQRTGFSIVMKKQATQEDLIAIASISRKVFRDSWGYTELTVEEFAQLYPAHKLAAHMSGLYLLYKGAEVIGFCGTAATDTHTLVCKTICILPEFRGLGLGNALAWRVHTDARMAGFCRIVYALIRDDNSIRHFPRDSAVIFRRYAAFEFRL